MASRSASEPTDGRYRARSDYGRESEALAASYLEARGLEIVGRNFRRRAGEIDLIARQGGILCLIEVRARMTMAFGGAAASVGPAKRRRLVRAAQLLLAAHPAWRALPVRFDVVLIQGRGAQATIEWIPHAFGAG